MNSFRVQFLSNFLKVTYSSQGITSISYLSEPADLPGPSTRREQEIAETLSGYLSQKGRELDLPVDWARVDGTQFQKKVWQALARIPFGEVRTYGEIAESLGNPGAARAVGSACGKNPLLLIVPCHRVVGETGLGGFSGGGLTVKRHLLSLENSLH